MQAMQHGSAAETAAARQQSACVQATRLGAAAICITEICSWPCAVHRILHESVVACASCCCCGLVACSAAAQQQLLCCRHRMQLRTACKLLMDMREQREPLSSSPACMLLFAQPWGCMSSSAAVLVHGHSTVGSTTICCGRPMLAIHTRDICTPGCLICRVYHCSTKNDAPCRAAAVFNPAFLLPAAASSSKRHPGLLPTASGSCWLQAVAGHTSGGPHHRHSPGHRCRLQETRGSSLVRKVHIKELQISCHSLQHSP